MCQYFGQLQFLSDKYSKEAMSREKEIRSPPSSSNNISNEITPPPYRETFKNQKQTRPTDPIERELMESIVNQLAPGNKPVQEKKQESPNWYFCKSLSGLMAMG